MMQKSSNITNQLVHNEINIVDQELKRAREMKNEAKIAKTGKETPEYVDPRPWRSPPNVIIPNIAPLPQELKPYEKDDIYLERMKEKKQKALQFMRNLVKIKN